MPDLRYLEYLRKLDRIVIPEEFTYWVHNTLYGINESRFDRMWETLPTNYFVVRREMSFVERDDRVKEAFDYGGVEKASNSYTVNKKGKNFQIRVIMPKRSLTPKKRQELGISDEENNLNELEYRGLGDFRHPKLKNTEKIYIFGSSETDEISGQKIDILYGIREQDIERYAKLVQRSLTELKEKPNSGMFTLPSQTLDYKYGDGEEKRSAAKAGYQNAVKATYSLKKGNMSRYMRKPLKGLDGYINAEMMSDFENEYYHEQSELQNESQTKAKQNKDVGQEK